MIEVQRLTKRYGSTLAVDDLSFRVEPGRVTGFLGPNGAGKTTTLRAMLGLDRPTSGRVLIEGRPYEEHPRPLAAVGALLDARLLHGGRTARGHLLGLARSNRIPDTRVGEVLETVGLASVARKRAGGLSLGMSQRVGIAAALLGDPRVLLFDEPINGLDPEGIVWFRELARRLAGEGRTVLVSSHLMSETAQTADHLVVIGQGRLLAESSVDDFVARNSRSYILIRTPEPDRLRAVLMSEGVRTDDGPDGALEVSGTTLETVGALAAENQVTVYEISPRTASLEEAFMRMTAGSVEFRANGDTAPMPEVAR
ncbi:ATP-binding cassette domain-containing protein [Streptomyces sp. N2-109]|uniref:ATP-binding cassette domain-containing protein n=1 Tax=Streptomyces gossypii TaxID=2883101 RepID=A0ABT2K3M8_9ACTN|nr:ATP-binding cassette domain-containing protein [Streptomyces gossypii]MCT2594782.1 ATP-binding cassette domain-containing protein [Streptomyces gossypii]